MKKFGVRLILIALGCMAGFLIGEVTLRLLLPNYVASAVLERNYFCQFDPKLGWAPLPNMSGLHRRDGFVVFVEQNQFGLRGPKSMRKGKSSGQQRTLVLGDSYVWGYGVAQDKVFTEAIVHGSDHELINFGVSGYGTDQAYLLYKEAGISFEADEVVLVFTTYNDVENNLSSRQYGHDKPYFTLKDSMLVFHAEKLKENRVQTIINKVWGQSRVVNLLFTAHRIHLAESPNFLRATKWLKKVLVFAKEFFTSDQRTLRKKQVLESGTAKPTGGRLEPSDVTERDLKGVTLTMAIIDKLQEKVLSTGSKFSVMFVPYKPHILHKISYNHPLVPILAKKLEAAGIPYYEPYFLFLNEINSEKLFNPTDNHFSQEGHRVFSRTFIDPNIRETTKNLY